MPKSLQELKNAKRDVKRAGGKKIEFSAIIQLIQKSGEYWTVTEVHKQLVKQKIGRFRTMKLLNGACATKKLERLYDNGRFYYGAPVTQE